MKADIDRGSAVPTQASPEFWLRPTSYWQPTHIPLSAWFTHAPFAAWLIDVLRPRTVVELGTHLGFSCFTFAEAAKRLRLDVRIHALDTWEGDSQTGFYGDDVYQSVRDIARLDYPDAVELHRGRFAQTRPLFADSSIDLLHIDGRHGYEDAVEDYEQWSPAVRDGGVIIFHDIEERENGFGVWRLWERLAVEGRSFTFHHGHGLGVLSVGEPAPGPLRDLFAADEATARRIREDYERLGDRVAHRYDLERTAIEARELVDRARQLEGLISERDARIAALESSTSWRVTAPLRAIGRLRRH